MFGLRKLKMPRIIVCKECGEEKTKYTTELCSFCYRKLRPKIICEGCGQKKEPHTTRLCRKCYNEEYHQRPEVKQQKKIYGKAYRQRNKEKIKKYHQDNKERLKIQRKEYYIRNKERIQEHRQKPKTKAKRRVRERGYNQKPHIKLKRKRYNRKKKVRTRLKKYRQTLKYKEYRRAYNRRPDVKAKEKERMNRPETRIRQNEWAKKRRGEDPKFRISEAISHQIYLAIKQGKAGKHWEDLVGYTLQDLILHLEKQFKRGMTWKNYGYYWHVEHRIPRSWFEFKNYKDEEFKECWALDNLKPMERILNIKKGNRYAEPTLGKWIKNK